MIKRINLIAICLSMLVLLGGLSYADQRSYVWTYEYMTMAPGEAELEFYNTLEQPSATDLKKSTWKPWVELEYGLTERWDISLYQQFKQTNTGVATTSAFAYDGYKIRTRYRFGERGQFLVDPLLYLEYIGKNDLSQSSQGEVKLILAKDVSRLNFAYNQIYKWTLNNDAAENEYAAGINLELNPAVRVGLESKGNYTSGKYYLGPTISFITQKLWATFGIVRGLNDKSDFQQARLLWAFML